MNEIKPPLDPHPLSDYVAWAGNRNRNPILEVLKQELPEDEGNVLEFASGSGMHINYFAPHFQHLTFYPSDKDQEVFENIEKLAEKHGNENVSTPSHLDLTQCDTWEHLKKNSFLFRYLCASALPYMLFRECPSPSLTLSSSAGSFCESL